MSQEQKASYKCLDKNNYDREACQQYFDAYKDCKNKMVSECAVSAHRLNLIQAPFTHMSSSPA